MLVKYFMIELKTLNSHICNIIGLQTFLTIYMCNKIILI